MMTSLAWVVLVTGSSILCGAGWLPRKSARPKAPEGNTHALADCGRELSRKTPRFGPPAAVRRAKIGIPRSHARYAKPHGAEMRNRRGSGRRKNYFHSTLTISSAL